MHSAQAPRPITFLTRQQIAEITDNSLPTVDGWLHHPDPAQRLPSFRLGGGVKILVRLDEFEDWLERNRTDGKCTARATRRRA